MAMEPVEPEAAANSKPQTASSGSGTTIEEKRADINAQNAKALEDGVKASLKRKSEDSGDDTERTTRDSAAAAATSLPSPRGRKREAENDADDEERMNRDTSVEQTVSKRQKRKDAEQDDAARTEDRAEDMSSLAQHPGPVHSGGRIEKGDLSWRHIDRACLQEHSQNHEAWSLRQKEARKG